MALIKEKIRYLFDSPWFSVILGVITVLSFIINCPYLGFYFLMFSLLLIVVFKTGFKSIISIIILLYANHQTFTRNYRDSLFIILIVLFGIVILVFLFNMFLNFKKYFEPLKKDWLFYSLIAILLTMILSLINTPVIIESLIGILMWLTIMFSYILIKATVLPTEKNKRDIVLSIIFSGWVICLEWLFVILLYLKSGSSVQKLVIYKATEIGWANTNHLTAFLNISIILTNFYFIKEKNLKLRIFVSISFCLFSFFSVISFCRGGYLSSILIFPLVFLFDFLYLIKSKISLKKKIILILFFVFSICSVVLVLYFTKFLGAVLDGVSLRKLTTSGRTNVYNVAIESFKAHPIIGAGVYTSRYYLEHLDYGIYNYHNYYLQIIATCGILGGLAFTAFLLFSVKRMMKKDLYSLFVFFVFLYFMIHGALDTLFFNPYIMPILCVLLALNNDSNFKEEFPFLFKKKTEQQVVFEESNNESL